MFQRRETRRREGVVTEFRAARASFPHRYAGSVHFPEGALSYSSAVSNSGKGGAEMGGCVLHDDQEAGCVEQPRHIRLSQNGAGNLGRRTCFFDVKYRPTAASAAVWRRCFSKHGDEKPRSAFVRRRESCARSRPR